MAIISKLLAISSLVILSANALDSSNHLGARAISNHAAIAKRRIDTAPAAKRGLKKRCKTRPPVDPPAPVPSPPVDNGGGSSGGDTGGGSGGDTGSGGNTGGGNTGGGSGGNQGGNAGGPNASGKLGFAWPNGQWDLPKWAGHRASWLYTWSPDCPSNAAELGFECVPMLWGRDHEYNFVQKTNQDGYARHALFVNEFNHPDQANMGVDEAVSLWYRAFQPLKAKGYTLISGAPTSAPNGFDWLKEFRSKCPGCMDRLALHYYDIKVEDFIAYMTKFHDEFNLDIWVTEVACQNFNDWNNQCNMGQIYDFIGRTRQWMEETPWIERYAYFGTMRDMTNVNTLNRMMNDDGTPNDLGWFYIGN